MALRLVVATTMQRSNLFLLLLLGILLATTPVLVNGFSVQVVGFTTGAPTTSHGAAPFVGSPDSQQRSSVRTAFWTRKQSGTAFIIPPLWAMEGDGEHEKGDEAGADLAAEFFKMAQSKGIDREEILQGEEFDIDDDGDDDDEEDEEEEEMNIPQGAINAFLGYDTGDVGEKLAGNVSLTDDKIYSEVKERVLDTAGGFVDYVKSAQDEEDGEGDDDDEEDDDGEAKKAKPYVPPTTVPDSELTAGEVIITVLDALLHNDVPTKNRGVEIFFGYSSEGSQVKTEVGLTPDEYAEFLKETEYKVLFDHRGVSIDKADYSFDGKKAFFTARLQTGPGPLDIVSVNFILSTTGVEDDACWLIDSMLIRPESMRRRRRR